MHRVVWMLVVAVVAAGQTLVDLKTQSKSVDFSQTNFTKPFQTGSTLPSLCSVGQMFFSTSATAGQNIYGCVSTNIWALQAGGSGGGGGGGGPGVTVRGGSRRGG